MELTAGALNAASPYDWLFYGALAISLLIILDSLLKARRRIFVSKRYDAEAGEVAIEIRNGSEELAGVRIIDRLPADGELGALGGGKIHERNDDAQTRTIRWSVPLLMPGERREFRYGLRTREKRLASVEVIAAYAREVRARSGEVRI